ncbi:hypothetical protein [Gordonia rubripertincta]|uniref:Uncharacterized protein n=1 Tax=Gordonia rubripertincta TaxID=36822 RepID=A0ABT4N401_GORRU|nr:hypothetical protein [Gordonia rubripertincta]MCZ4553675.1 hypothetical protein [Gordonia rubripertincta]
MTTPPELFARCVLPGCTHPADEQGHPCPDCSRAFTGYLHPAAARPVTEAEQHDRDEHIRAAQRAHLTVAAAAAAADTTGEALTKPNQRCWLCDERRTCTRISGQWECRQCQTVL